MHAAFSANLVQSLASGWKSADFIVGEHDTYQDRGVIADRVGHLLRIEEASLLRFGMRMDRQQA